MNFQQLRDWVNDPARSPAELDLACTGLGLATGTPLADIVAHIDAQPDLTAASPWTPAGWTAPPPVAALVITTTSPLPAATARRAFTRAFAATGGTPPYTTWTATGLPLGITINPATGVLAGTAVAGTITFDVTVTDASGVTANRHFTMTVNAAARPAWLVPAVIVGGIAVVAVVAAMALGGGSGNKVAANKPAASSTAVAKSANELLMEQAVNGDESARKQLMDQAQTTEQKDALKKAFGSSNKDDQAKALATLPSSGSSSSTPGATGTTSVLTETRAREIATDVANKAVADKSITAAQVKELVDKAVTDAMATIAKTGGLSETQVRGIVADVMKNAAANPATTPTPMAGQQGSGASGSGNSSGSRIQPVGLCTVGNDTANQQAMNWDSGARIWMMDRLVGDIKIFGGHCELDLRTATTFTLNSVEGRIIVDGKAHATGNGMLIQGTKVTVEYDRGNMSNGFDVWFIGGPPASLVPSGGTTTSASLVSQGQVESATCEIMGKSRELEIGGNRTFAPTATNNDLKTAGGNCKVVFRSPTAVTVNSARGEIRFDGKPQANGSQVKGTVKELTISYSPNDGSNGLEVLY